MTTDNQWEVEEANDIDIEADEAASAPVAVQQLVSIAMVRRNGRPQLHVAWEPRSYKQVWNKADIPWRKDDYTHDWLTSHSGDGRLMGGDTDFGVVRAAFEEVAGVPLQRNEQFQPLLQGRIFKTVRVRRPYSTTDDLNGEARKTYDKAFIDCSQDEKKAVRAAAPTSKASYFIKPIEALDEYTPPANPKVVRLGFKDTIEVAEATSAQNAALRAALNGRATDEYINALLESGDDLIICDPFMTEAGDGDALTERLTALGGKVVNGKIYFAEVG